MVPIMKIPIPCKLGEYGNCNGKILPLKGVSWFKLSQRLEYVYFFEMGSKWKSADFYMSYQTEQPFFIEIPDALLENDFLKNKDYPLKGTGYADGIYFIGGQLYIDFIVTDNYFAHIRVQCNNKGKYIPGGNMIFPPSYDTEEKREKFVLKSAEYTFSYS